METTFLSATVLLILITDPLGNIPLFIAALAQVRPERRLRLVTREVLIAFAVLMAFMLFGRGFLAVMHLSGEALSVAGGVILLLIAIDMVFPHRRAQPADHGLKGEPFIVPLAILRNGFRVYVIGELCVQLNHDWLYSWIHRQGGPVFFALSLLPFFGLLIWLRKSESKRQNTVKT